MAEQASSTAIVPSPPTLDGEYMIEIKDFTAAGAVNKFKLAVPNDFTSQQATVMLRAGILKATSWKDKPFPMVLHAVMYADNMGLDIMAGDVYSADEGRLSTTAGAKIRHAMASGKIAGYSCEITEGAPLNIEYTLREKKQVYDGPELTAKVTVHVVGWANPITYEAKLSEWFTGRNPNWRSRPAYMLRKNALSKAFEEVAPMGVDADEAPPVDIPTASVPVLKKKEELPALTTSIKTEDNKEKI